MKSQLDARPVFMQKQETITGHFLICYLSVLLTRLFQIHVLKDEYGTEEIFDFIRDFRVVKISDRKYINLTRSSSFIKDLTAQTDLPLTSYFLGNEDINKMLSHRFQPMAQHYFFNSTPKDRFYIHVMILSINFPFRFVFLYILHSFSYPILVILPYPFCAIRRFFHSLFTLLESDPLFYPWNGSS